MREAISISHLHIDRISKSYEYFMASSRVFVHFAARNHRPRRWQSVGWLRRKRRHYHHRYVGPLIAARQYEGWTLLPADCLIMHFYQRTFRAQKKYLSNAPSRVAYSQQCRRPIAIHFRVNIIGRRHRLLYTSWCMYAANDKVESSGKKDTSAMCTDKKMVISTEC